MLVCIQQQSNNPLRRSYASRSSEMGCCCMLPHALPSAEHNLKLVAHPLQRNDLRRSRMELAAATEDANQARQELRVVRAELARSRAQQATVSQPSPEITVAFIRC